VLNKVDVHRTMQLHSRNIVADALSQYVRNCTLHVGILAEGAMTLPVTLSGGVLFAS
jgi:hypothetical protein